MRFWSALSLFILSLVAIVHGYRVQEDGYFVSGFIALLVSVLAMVYYTWVYTIETLSEEVAKTIAKEKRNIRSHHGP
ncbi:MAG: hypothetical protein WC866_01005 [Patescibacteria group bacterium]|jgi:hypothetical protein